MHGALTAERDRLRAGVLVADSQVQMTTDAQWQLVKTARQQADATRLEAPCTALRAAAVHELRCMQQLLQNAEPERAHTSTDLDHLVESIASRAIENKDERIAADCMCAGLRLRFLQNCCHHWSEPGAVRDPQEHR